MSFPSRIAVYWRALEDSPSHFQAFESWPDSTRLLFLLGEVRQPPELRHPGSVAIEELRRVGFGHPALRWLSGWKKRLARFAPDLILSLDEPYCLQTAMFARFADKAGIPLVFLSCQNIDRKQFKFVERIERSVLRTASGAWFLNADAQHRAARRGFLGKSKVIPLGFDPVAANSSFNARSANREAQPFTVGYAGRLVSEKGVDLLIEACAQAGVALAVAGEGPMRPAWEQRARDLHLTVNWSGPLEDRQVYDFYSTIDALVLPSRTTPSWKEQFGRVLVEAMGAGVPVIGSDSGEIPRVIGDCGIVFPEGDTDRLTDALRGLAASPSECDRLRKAGRDRATTRFTWERVSADLTALIHTAVHNLPRSS